VVVGDNRSDWLLALVAGDRAALARALTAVENDLPEASAVLAACAPRLGRATVLGVTGPPGAGKSTLVAALAGRLRATGRTVGILAVDPSSPLSGGAFLGDRVRMVEHSGDPGVFVRSLAARGHLGGLARSAARAIDVMDASGRDVVIVETVGVGQSEIEIADLADVRLVVWQPGSGDEIQAAKAGLLEIADAIVVNKADLPEAARAARNLEAAVLASPPERRPLVLRASATRGDGVPELAEAVEAIARARKGRRQAGPRTRARRLIAEAAAAAARASVLGASSAELDRLCDRVAAGAVTPAEAARLLGEGVRRGE
jgi:LAO/AO transport system kinase